MSVTPDEARQAASEQRDRLVASDPWANAFANAQLHAPVFVRTVPPMPPYFIVQFRRGDSTTGLMLVNPETGKVEGFTGARKPGTVMRRFLLPEEVPAILEERGVRPPTDFPAGLPKEDRVDFLTGIKAADVSVERELFWEPCDQSLSPFKPFYAVQHTEPAGVRRFLVRSDGEVFARTTQGGAGL